MSRIACYEGAAPGTPPAGVVYLYAKTDGRWYFKADDGVEEPVKSVGAGTGDLLADGTVPLTANWDVGPYILTALRFVSDVPTGTAPFTVASTTLVTNLNADLLDGNEASAFATSAQGSAADTALQPADIGTSIQAWSAVLDATTASFLIADETKLDGIDPVASAQSNLSATAAPTTTDDTNAGYSVGSVWIDTTNDNTYVCVDATASAAIWAQTNAEVLNTYNETAAPTVNDDSVDGYSPGSMWVDTTNDAAYICLDATAAAAVWQQLGSGSGGGGMSPEFKSAAYTASAGDKVFVDCSGGAVTITLPASPSTGDEVMVLDSSGDAATNNVTVGRNSETIDGTAADFVIDLNYGSCSFAYNGSDWKINPANGVS